MFIRNINAILSVSLLALIAYMLVKALGWNMDLPVVNYSYSKNACVAVYSPVNTHYTCSNLPRKYEKQWVK